MNIHLRKFSNSKRISKLETFFEIWKEKEFICAWLT